MRTLRQLAQRIKWQVQHGDRGIRNLMESFAPTICIDVGASYFPHGAWWFFLGCPQSEWFAVDPNAANLGYVGSWPHKAQVSAVPIGLSDSGGDKTLHITNVDSGSSLFPPVITESNKHRVGRAQHEYFFPVREETIRTVTLAEIAARSATDAPIVVKLDTQGSEVSILEGSKSLLASHRIVGIELECTLLAEPFMNGSGTLCGATTLLFAHGYELLGLDPIQGGSLYGSSQGKTKRYVNECDAIFALRRDIAAMLPIGHRLSLLAFYISNSFFDEARSLAENDAEVSTWLAREPKRSAQLARYLKKRT